jgi:hypothetical protein
MEMSGHRRHSARLRKLARSADRMGALVFALADDIKTDARRSITEGSTSGKGHVASLPGEPPNRDTGHLDTNIEAYRTGPLKAEVRSQAGYAVPLEMGTRKMAERPYMRPATKRARARIPIRARVEVGRMIRES